MAEEQAGLRVAIAVFDDVDLLDVGGPYEVLLTASRLARRDGRPAPFAVITVGRGPARAYGGLTLVPERTFVEVGAVDLLVVPGAVAIDAVRGDRGLLAALRPLAQAAGTVASVCTGALLLADLGLLPDRWTTHWEDVEALGPAARTHGDASVRWVDAGRVVTSGGLSSGIAMALHLVDRFASRDLAVRTARQIDYVWDPGGGRLAREEGGDASDGG
jgi:transcriptional regulator GlxA family with amidase domain